MGKAPLDLEAIFFAARHKEGAARAIYLDEICEADPELRHRVEQFLSAQAELGSFLEGPVPSLLATVDSPCSEGPGTIIGPYKLLEQIGEGGFGVVFMAEQQYPVRRKVALKVLKPGMDTRQVIARFEAERQALALMDHPSIAKVHDAGTTESGRPYFVMELVKGIPITEYCDQEQLTTRQRLELFAPVCQAVQHAHQKGIIHRDIKPSNVLVTLLDGVPVPKVIDFGVAKATGEPLTDKSLFTGFAQMIGTPMYMSPEQANLSGHDVDTRSDIYSLGVLLYELLTGTTPFDNARFKEVGYDEMRRIIREEEPPKPSTRLSTLGQAATTLSIQRKSDPRKLSQLFRGELDWIVMKCLEKDRNRRYETANSLARDIERYLHDEPVQACPPSAWYRFRKYARRNKGLLAIASVVAVALMAGMAGLVVSNVLIGRARQDAVTALDKAKDKRDLALQAVEDMWVDVAENWLQDEPALEQTQRKFVQKALAFYERLAEEEADNPDVAAEVGKAHFRMAVIHDRLGNLARSEASYTQAADMFGRLAQADPRNVEYRYWQARSLAEHADVCDRLGRGQDAENLSRQALALFEKAASDFPDELRIQAGLADCCVVCGSVNYVPGPRIDYVYLPEHARILPHLNERERHLRRACDIYPQVIARGRDKSEHRWRFHRAQRILSRMPGVSGIERERLTRDSIDGFEQLIKDFRREHRPRTELGEALCWSGYLLLWHATNPTEAEKVYQRACQIADELAESYPTVPYYRKLQAYTRSRLGLLLDYMDRPGEAEPLLAQAAVVLEQVPEGIVPPWESPHEAARCYAALGKIHAQAGRLAEAEQAYRHAMRLDLHVARIDENNDTVRFVSTDCWLLTWVLSRAGRVEDGVQAFRDAVAARKQGADTRTGDWTWAMRGWTLNELGLLLLRLSRFEEAEQAFIESQVGYADLVRNYPGHAFWPRDWAIVHGNRARLRWLSGRPEEAVTFLRQRVDWLTQHASTAPNSTAVDRAALARSWVDLGKGLEWVGKAPESGEAYQGAVREFERLGVTESEHRNNAIAIQMERARVFHGAGRADEANRVADEAVAIRRSAAASGGAHDHRNLATTLSDQAVVRCRTGRLDEAAAAFAEAEDLLIKLITEGTDASAAQESLAMLRNRRGRLWEHSETPTKAEAEYVESAALRRQLAQDVSAGKPENIRRRIAHAESLTELARFRLRHHQAEQAVKSCAEALAIYEEIAASLPGHPAANSLTWFLVTCPVESLRDPSRAFRLADKALFQDKSWQGNVVRTLGVAQYRVGNHRSAVASLDLQTRLGDGRARPEDLYFRGMAHWSLGEKQAARKDYGEAVRLMGWHDDRWSELDQFREEAANLLGVPPEKSKE